MKNSGAYAKATLLREGEHFVEAYHFYEEAVTDGEIKGYYWLAYIMTYKLGESRHDFEEAESLFRKYFSDFQSMGEAGDPEALFFLGSYYENAFPPIIKKDSLTAKKFFVRAAEKGSAIAWNCLGNLQRDEEKNFPSALADYIKSSDLGFPSACNNAANLYYYGAPGIPVDLPLAFHFFKKGAAEENRYSENNLGRMYLLGEACEKNAKEAFRLFTLSAKQNYPRAFYNLGCCYRNGYYVPKNDDTALKWFLKAIDNATPHALSFFEIRSIFLEKGDKENKEKIEQRLSEFLSRTFPDQSRKISQQILLSRCYEEGIGRSQNMQASLDSLSKGANEMGDAECAYLLSQRYGDENSPFFDLELSEKYLKLSAEEGYVASLYAYALFLEKRGKANEAFTWFQRGAKALHPECLAKVGVYFLFGLGGCEINIDQGKWYLEKAYEHGNNATLFYLYALGGTQGEINSKNAMALYANGFNWLGENQETQYQKIQNDLITTLKPMWPHLQKSSQTALISGMVNYISYKAMEKKGLEMDFSQVSNPFSKAVEIEIAHLFYQGFLDYLRKRHISLNSYSEKKCFFICLDSKGQRSLADSANFDLFTLGRFDSLIGKKTKIVSKNNPFFEEALNDSVKSASYGSQEEFVSFDSNFLNFCEESFVQNPLRPWSRDDIAKLLSSLSKYLNLLTQRYRNKGSHKGILNSFDAEACGNLILMVQKLLFSLESCFFIQ